MANTLVGKVIAISKVQTITGRESGKQVSKRQLFMDCTRFDPYTGERGFENTPLLEFSHKGLEKLEALIQQGLKKDDVVTVTFDVQGVKYTDKDNKMQVFTSIRPYNIELTKPKGDTQQQTAPAPQQAAPAPAQGQQAAGEEPIPGVGNDLPF